MFKRTPVTPTPKQYEEYLKLLYDLSKHITTLSTATAVVFVTLSRDDPARLYVPLFALLVAIILALLSMHRILGLVGGEPMNEQIGTWLIWLQRCAFTALFVAVGWFGFSDQL